MRLSELFSDIPITKDIDIKGITNNSNEVKPGYLFAAVKGTKTDGSRFIEDAVSRGASAILCEKEARLSNNVIFINVNCVSDLLWRLGKKFYRDPSSRLSVIGITGTNGKTTTSYLIRNIFEKAGITTGLLGTINYLIGRRQIPAELTTPCALKVNKYLGEMIDNGCKACVMEVSSHALEQGRVNGIDFKAAVYTNLGRDHLDYHKTIDNYLEAKTKLFKKLNSDSWAVVNMDDPYSKNILHNTLSNVTGYGIGSVTSSDLKYKIRAKGIVGSHSGTRFSVHAAGFNEAFSVETKLIGNHNVYNILASIGTALIFGIDTEIIKEGIFYTDEIPGRLEEIDMGQPFGFFIDYAHTPDALENVLNTMRGITKNRLILVFGCGGDRDKGKRPLMGRIANRMADYTIITTDNPRGEDPLSVISDIEKGFVSDNYRSIRDRKDAIKEAINICKNGDVLLIAGKGHENYQILQNTVVPFSDRSVAEEFLKVYAGSYC